MKTLHQSTALSMGKYKDLQLRMSDSQNSNISFTVTLSGDNKLHGCFTDFDAGIVLTGTDLSTSFLKMNLYSDSVKADTPTRTHRFMGPSCLNVSQHRVVTFESTAWKKITEKEFLLYGELSFRGKQKLVAFEVTDHGISAECEGKPALSTLEFNGVIKKSDFDLAPDAYPPELAGDIVLKGVVVFRIQVARRPFSRSPGSIFPAAPPAPRA